MQTEGVMPILQLSQALLTPLIAVVATYIAWQQWRSNLLKLRLERYERRLRVYEEVIRILSIIGRDANATPEDLMKFRAAAAEADFLFGPEIPEYIDEIYSRGLKLWRANKEYRDYTQPIPPGYDHKKVVDEIHAQTVWLSEQFPAAKDKFRKYLDVSK
jgi:hypothetical protein